MPPRATRSPRRAAASSPNKPPLYPPGLGFTPEANKNSAHIAPTPTPTRSGALPCIAYVVLYHVAFIGALVLWHSSKHGFNPTQAFLAVFCVINAWIAVCELALLFYPGLIQQQHADYRYRTRNGVAVRTDRDTSLLVLRPVADSCDTCTISAQRPLRGRSRGLVLRIKISLCARGLERWHKALPAAAGQPPTIPTIH